MRHFRNALRQRGVFVHYCQLDKAGNHGRFLGELSATVSALCTQKLIVVEPGEWRVRETLQSTARALGLDLEMRPDRHFLCSREEFARHAKGRKQCTSQGDRGRMVNAGRFLRGGAGFPDGPARKRMGRPPTSLRPMINAVFYLVKSGCPWRLLPKSFPKWKTVYDRFRKWCRDGTWLLLNHALRGVVRVEDGRDIDPSAAALDSQTVRSDGHGGEVGYDAGKKTKGRKRFIIVDTLGLLLGVVAVPANVPERAGAQQLLKPLLPALGRLSKLWVDGGYSGPEFAGWVREQSPKLEVEVIKRSDDVQGFKVLPRRWVVERTFGWLVQHRRLVRDYEKTECSAAGWIAIALVRVMLRRLTSTHVI